MACENGEVATVESMVKEDGKLLHVKNEMRANATPFMAASGKCQIEVCKKLLEMKANINAEDNFQWTALNWATQDQKQEMIKFLEENGGEMGEGEMDSDDDD